MTKRIRNWEKNFTNVCVDKPNMKRIISLKGNNKMPHYKVIGELLDFYLNATGEKRRKIND